MRCEVVAIGTELLLGQIVDTNSSWLGERLALAGIDSHFQTKVGDNLDRMVLALRTALARSEAVIVCGGLGPTQDDITREALAQVMNVPLVRDEEMVAHIEGMFAGRDRAMPENNKRQAERPEGSAFIPNPNGTAPGLLCTIGQKVVYATPGVPHEMKAMAEAVVLPDLQARSGETAVILSRTLRTWGLAESAVAEVVAPRLDLLDQRPGGPTIDSWPAASRASRCGSRPRHRPWRRPQPCSSRRTPSCGPCWGRWCSVSTTRTWSRRWAPCSWGRACRWGWPSR